MNSLPSLKGFHIMQVTMNQIDNRRFRTMDMAEIRFETEWRDLLPLVGCSSQ